MNNQEEKEFYSPGEVAEMLHVSVDQLRQMRWQGRIKGTSLGNSTVYTLKQIQAADLKPWPRGRKKGKKNAADGHDISMMLKQFGKALQVEGSCPDALIA